MKMTNGSGYGAQVCDLTVSPTFTFYTRTDCDLERESIGYAACRFLRHSPRLCQVYVKRSHDLRFAKGKARKSIHCFFVAPSLLMELPGAWAHVRISISASGVMVEHVGIYLTLASAQEAASRRFSPRYNAS